MFASLNSFVRALFSRSGAAGNVLLVYKVPGMHMERTIQADSLAYVDRRAYVTDPIKRGDVVAYGSPPHVLVMRAVGLPGDVVELIEGTLHINRERVWESYVDWQRGVESDYSMRLDAVTVPEGCLYVLGDFRDMSKDSRADGPVKIKDVIGRVVRVKHGGMLRDVQRVE
jgi:signal peptidase I